ncbi:hypothetical protein J6A64_03540 [bacterium]|nr:hypothetical protein [bacterium]MBO5446663.1 hypothetical protein [bacterium]
MSEFITDRKTVANLLRSVRLGNCSVREAMLLYPKDTTDESLVAAYHALIHYEADEDLRRRDPLYKEEQDDYIEFLSYILDRGEDLPSNIIANYKKYYDTAPILHKDNTQGFFKSFWRNLNVGFNKEK